jgi:hypothetical protein
MGRLRRLTLGVGPELRYIARRGLSHRLLEAQEARDS